MYPKITNQQYRISIDYDDYFANSSSIKSYNLEIVGDSIMFFTDSETLKILEAKDIRYMIHQNPKEKIKNIFKFKTGILIGIIIVSFMITLNSFRVSKIIFNGEYPVNDEIEEYINVQNKKLLFFNLHKNNYQELAKNLRSTFNEYEWISIEKKGSKVYVFIEETSTKKIELNDNDVGDIVAKKNGIISEFKVFNGSSNLSENQYIKAGDILISGDKSKARGFVLATVYEEQIIIVNKQEVTQQFSGQATNYNEISLFKKSFNLNKSVDYINSEKKYKTLFEIPYIFSINKIEEYEKNDIILTYNKKEAITFATNYIVDTFNQNKILNDEGIIRVEVITVTENDDSFEIKFMVKKIESIGEFKSRI